MEKEEMITRLMDAARNSFDEEEGMIAQVYKNAGTGYHSQKMGKMHPITVTAVYAAAAFTLGTKEDYAKAIRAIERICELQDTREGSKTFGLWSYYMEEDLDHMLAPDYNRSDFVGKHLLDIGINHKALLPEGLWERLCNTIRNAMKCSIQRNVGADYTNMSIMSCMTLISAGELLEDKELFTIGKERLEKLYEYTKFNGAFSEYNSSTYILISMNEIARMLAFFKDERCRFIAEELNRYAWQMLASHYNMAIKQLTPPQARAYRDLENGSLEWAIWLGTDGRYGSEATEAQFKEWAGSLETLCFPSKCPEDMFCYFDEIERFMADIYYKPNQIRSLGEDVTIIRELDSPQLIAYSYQTKEFSMGAFEFCDTWNQRRNCMVLWDKEHPKYFRLRGIEGDYDFCSGVVKAQQDKNRILGQLGLVSDRGSFHYILDKEKNGIYETNALYFKFEFGGETEGLKIVQRGKDFYIEDKSLRIILHVEQWIYDGKEAPVTLAEDGNAVILEGYRGDKISLDTTKLQDTYGIFSLTVENLDNKAEQSEIEVRYLPERKVESTWGNLKVSSYQYTVPYRKALGLE